jgi:phage-related protein
MVDPTLRPLVWVGGTRKEYAAFPSDVQDNLGYALYLVQAGEKVVPGAKPLAEGVLKGLGVFELVDDFDGDTYRAVYTVRLGSVVYVLHAFKKKSKRGIATPQHEIELIRARYETAVRIHRERFGGSSR